MPQDNQHCSVPWVKMAVTGQTLIRNSQYNKGMAFTRSERKYLDLEGLFPYQVLPINIQRERVCWNLSRMKDPLSKYVYLMSLLERNERLFYSVLIRNIVELMPIVYTPTVGRACEQFGHIFTQPRCLQISLSHKGCIRSILDNWPKKNVKAIVFTDGERILGLGDLGACGMGIPIGKLCLYTACAGIPPQYLLPVHIDVGTNNSELLNKNNRTFYIGLKEPRDTSSNYDELIEEFMEACSQHFGPSCLLQFEDFGNRNALRLLNKFKNRYCTFNDDIQGTAAVALAGIYNALKLKSNEKLSEQVILLFGAGSAGLGIAELIACSICRDENKTIDEARSKIQLVDSRGLIYKNRKSGGITESKAFFEHSIEKFVTKEQDLEQILKNLESKNLAYIVKLVKATALLGVSARRAEFNYEVIRAMCENTDSPIIFPMSNPDDKSECTALEAFEWSDYKCIFASGSPFPELKFPNSNKTIVPSQANNAYVFPGLALGAIASGSTRILDPDFFLIAAKALARQITSEELESGQIYPKLDRIREVSLEIAIDIAEEVFRLNLNSIVKPKNISIRQFIQNFLYDHENYDVYINNSIEDLSGTKDERDLVTSSTRCGCCSAKQYHKL